MTHIASSLLAMLFAKGPGGDFSVGFTGSQKGMWAKQYETFTLVVYMLGQPITDFHHGDCVGADKEAHEFIVRAFPQCTTHVHPGIVKGLFNHRKRAYCKGHVPYTPEDTTARNTLIASQKTLIAAPHQYGELVRSGTWQTIRLFAKMNETQGLDRPLWIIRPDGTVQTVFKSVLNHKIVAAEAAQEWSLFDE